MTHRFHLIWPLVALSLALAILSGYAAFGLVREQRDAAADLRGEVEQHRSVAELEECFIELIALVKDRVRKIESIHERADSLLKEGRNRLTDSNDRKQLEAIDNAFHQHLAAWDALPDDESAIDTSVVFRLADRMDRELVRPSHQLETACSLRLQQTAEAHSQLLRRTTWGLVLVGGIGGVAGLVFGFGVSQGVSRSIHRLQVQVRDAAGKLDPTASEIVLTGNGNVVALHDEMDSLSVRIEQFVAKLQQRDREVLRSEQLAALGQLAAGMAHEVRNPLTSIKLLVQSELESSSPGGMATEDLRVIVSEVLRMERSLQHFLDYARPPSLERRRIDLGAVVQSVMGLIRVRAANQKVDMQLVVPEVGVEISADESQMQQVVLNLSLNALDVMPRGGHLTFTLRREGAWAELLVSDTGPGIAVEIRDRLFQPFATSKDTGLGLGLVITQRIVEAHGGQVGVLPKEPPGTTMKVTLPAEFSGR